MRKYITLSLAAVLFLVLLQSVYAGVGYPEYAGLRDIFTKGKISEKLQITEEAEVEVYVIYNEFSGVSKEELFSNIKQIAIEASTIEDKCGSYEKRRSDILCQAGKVGSMSDSPYNAAAVIQPVCVLRKDAAQYIEDITSLYRGNLAAIKLKESSLNEPEDYFNVIDKDNDAIDDNLKELIPSFSPFDLGNVCLVKIFGCSYVGKESCLRPTNRDYLEFIKNLRGDYDENDYIVESGEEIDANVPFYAEFYARIDKSRLNELAALEGILFTGQFFSYEQGVIQTDVMDEYGNIVSRINDKNGNKINDQNERAAEEQFAKDKINLNIYLTEKPSEKIREFVEGLGAEEVIFWDLNSSKLLYLYGLTAKEFPTSKLPELSQSSYVKIIEPADIKIVAFSQEGNSEHGEILTESSRDYRIIIALAILIIGIIIAIRVFKHKKSQEKLSIDSNEVPTPQKSKKWLWILLAIVLVILILGSIWVYNMQKKKVGINPPRFTNSDIAELFGESDRTPSCKDMCGDGECAEIVCMAEGCPCSETAASCPEDCNQNP